MNILSRNEFLFSAAAKSIQYTGRSGWWRRYPITRTKYVRFIFSTFLLTLSAATQSQSDAPQTPLGKLALTAGTYLGSLEYMRVFKSTDCGYVLTRDFPSLDQALVGEIIPAFPPEARSEVVNSMRENRPVLSRQATEYVNMMVAAAKKDHDRNTGCGLIAGVLAGIYSRTYEDWSANKIRYGWKGR